MKKIYIIHRFEFDKNLTDWVQFDNFEKEGFYISFNNKILDAFIFTDQ